MDVADLRAKIRDIKDFPTEGILFKDITTLLKDGPAWRFVVDSLASRYQGERVDVVVGVESRGFIFGGAIAHQLNGRLRPRAQAAASCPARPSRSSTSSSTAATRSRCTRTRSRPASACWRWTTCSPPAAPWRATLRLIEQLGGHVVGVAFMIELAFLHGREKLKNYPLHSLIVYD